MVGEFDFEKKRYTYFQPSNGKKKYYYVKGLMEYGILRSGQVWELKNKTGGDWHPYVVMSVSVCEPGFTYFGRRVYLSSVKTGRNVNRGYDMFLKGLNCRRVS